MFYVLLSSFIYNSPSFVISISHILYVKSLSVKYLVTQINVVE